jgi:hypothetical protein
VKILRGADGSLTIRVRPGILPEGVLALVVPLPLWKLLFEGPYPVSELPLLLLGSLIAALCITVFAEFSDFTFDPLRNELRWSRKTFYSRQGGQVPLRDVRGVVVASELSRKGSLLHQAVLSLRGRQLPLTRYLATGGSSEKAAQAIQDFLAARGLPEPEPERPRRTAVAFHQGPAGQWMVWLDCGHHAPVRHEPPWVDLLTEQGRKNALGMSAACEKCATGAPKDASPGG